MINILLILTFLVNLRDCQDYDQVRLRYKGCFKDNANNRDLPYDLENFQPLAVISIDKCVSSCSEKYFRYAGLQNGTKCFCGNSYGRYGPDKCNVRCPNDFQDVCGGELKNSVYETGVRVPGPPSTLKLEKAEENSLKIRWSEPKYSSSLNSKDDFITQYHITVTVSKSFDKSVNNRTFSPKEIRVGPSQKILTVLGLKPASEYNVTVAAASVDGQGMGISAFYETVIGDPQVPQPPNLLHHGDHDHNQDFDGEIHVQLKPLYRNKYGPISKYRVLVLDETRPSPFLKDQTYGYVKAKTMGLNYWIAAQFDGNNLPHEFVVGDNRTYGGYWNYGPLPKGRDFHVSLGVVSTHNLITKYAYAKVSHDQHAMENIVVFEFHDHLNEGGAHGHDHNEHHRHEHDHDVHDEESTDHALEIGLGITVAIVALIFFALLAVYAYLKITTSAHRRSSTSSRRSDAQELTPRMSTLASIELNEAQNFGFDNDSVDVAYVGTQLDNIRSRVWNIPRNFLDLTHEVIGRGQFGSLVKGNVNKRGKLEAVNIQVVPTKILEDSEMVKLVQDIDIVLKYGENQNLIQFIGLCEDKDTLFVVFEQAWPTLKKALLDSRALDHYPQFAKDHSKFSTLREDVITNIMLGIANGMNHLARHGISHKKLCAWNIFLADQVPKIGALGVVNYTLPDQEVTMARWTAQEALKSQNNYVWKCDVWSLAVVFWECATLGATPYCDLMPNELWLNVTRGSRLKQPRYMSDEFYQMLLNCWQIDLDERPNFEDIISFLNEMINFGHVPFNFNLYPNFAYEKFKPDLEFKE